MSQTTFEEPAKGGSYVRNEDGSLTRVEGTEPAKPRDKREADQPAATPDTTAPAKTTAGEQE